MSSRSLLLVASIVVASASCTRGSTDTRASAPGAPEADPADDVLTSPTGFARRPTKASRRASMKHRRDAHTSTLLPNGKVLVIGGEEVENERTMLASIELYDPASDTWEELAPLPEPRADHTATLLDDGNVLVVGGGLINAIGVPSGLEVRAEALLVDPETGRATAIGTNVTPRSGHRAARLPSGKVLIVGGAGSESTVKPSQGMSNPQPFGNELAETEVFDPTTRTFSPAGALNEARFAFALTPLADGRVLAMGGAAYASEARSLATTEIFDEATGVFSPAGDFVGEDRLFLVSTLLADGRVLAFGGKKSNVSFLADTQIFDPTKSRWSQGPNVRPARTMAALVPLDDGGALVIGGLSCGPGSCQSSDETQIVGASEKVAAGPTLRAGRASATATVLPDGSVLLVGGYGTQALASVELLE